ncbi:MAG: DUF2088 domain-containing protein [Acidobacteria bacterium]|nr:MAG: DUF2088 domain-containing protein [Acidobacteriota bacterium]
MNSDCIHLTTRGEKLRFHYGHRLRWEEVPEGSRVVYAPDPLPPVQDLREAVALAIDNPLGCDPLSAQLEPDMKVTIAFDDLSVPIPPIPEPDPRQVVIELLLAKLAEKGVTDTHLIAATGLHRRMTPQELRRMLGARIFDSCYPDTLYCHDAEDSDGNQFLGKTDCDEVVELNRRAVTSDLLIYVSIVFSSMEGGHKSIHTRLATYRTARFHHNVECLLGSASYMDPARSRIHAVFQRMGQVTARNLNIFHIEMTLNTAAFPAGYSFLSTREDRQTVQDWVRFHTTRTLLPVMPAPLVRFLTRRFSSGYGVTSVQAGSEDAVHRVTLKNVHRQQIVSVKGQTDILVAGIPNLGPYCVDSIMNPILVVNLAAGYLFNLSLGKPLVRRGGVLIIMHPLKRQFDESTHPSYPEFFDRVLADARDPYLIQDHEPEFASNEQYIEQYRHGYAFHGVHPFHAWYWAIQGMEYLSRIIVVGAQDKHVAERIGWDTASSLREAIEKAKTSLNKPTPTVSVFHWPPLFLTKVS